jgi:hypothetical protein
VTTVNGAVAPMKIAVAGPVTVTVATAAVPVSGASLPHAAATITADANMRIGVLIVLLLVVL